MIPKARFGRFQQHRAGSVPEQDRGGAVQWIDDRAHEVRAHDYDPLMHTAGNHLRTGRECVEEAGARG